MGSATTGPAAIIDPSAGRVMATIMNNDHDLLEFLLEDFRIVKANVFEVSELGIEWSASPQLADTEAETQTSSTPISSQSNNTKTEHHQASRNSEARETRQETPQIQSTREDTDSLAGTATPRSPAIATKVFGTVDPTPERLASWATFKSRSPETAIALDSTQSRYARTSIRPLGQPSPPNGFSMNVEESPQVETPRQHTELDNDWEYRELLEKVIEASRTLRITSQGPFNFDEMRNALPFDPDEM